MTDPDVGGRGRALVTGTGAVTPLGTGVENFWDAALHGADAVYLVPQGTVRMLVVGHDDRPATAAERTRMAAVVRQGLVDGAVGLSSSSGVPALSPPTDTRCTRRASSTAATWV